MATQHRMNADDRRAAIVEAAVSLFSDRGFRGATTRELAAAVGVTEPVLYRHFATKQALYDAIIESRLRSRNTRPDDKLTALIEAQDDQGVFTRLGELILDWYLEDPRYVRLLLYSGLEGHQLSELFFARQVEVFYQHISKYLRARMNAGALRKADPTLAVQAFAGMLVHQGLSYVVFGKGSLPARRKRVVAGVVKIFLEGLKCSPQTEARSL